MIEFISKVNTVMEQKRSSEDIIKIDALVEDIFQELGRRDNEE